MNTQIPSEHQVFEIVGVAVLSIQMFEAAFVMAARLALKQADINDMEDIVPISKAKSFKQPIVALIKELDGAGQVDKALVDRVVALVEKRHRIIHREYLETGWPLEDDLSWRREFFQLCTEVSRECLALTPVLASQLIDWMERFPEMKDTAKKRRGQIEQLLQRVQERSGVAQPAR